MGTFTLTTVETVAKDAFFIPNANGCATQLIPVGAANNWECVDDPVAIPDEDATYVYSSAINLKYDLYHLPNHTTESGTINYIQVYARTKSYEQAQHANGIFKLILTDNNCANIYKSEDIDLITSYSTYDNLWLKNPRTTNDFTWDDFDNLQIGIECDSPTISSTPMSLTIRPDSNNVVTLHNNIGENYDCVRDIAVGSYVYASMADGGVYKTDLYNTDNHTTEIGTITSVDIFMKVFGAGTDLSKAKTVIKENAITTYGVEHSFTFGWHTFSDSYAVKPSNSVAWSWADIDNLISGVSLWRDSVYGSSSVHTRCCAVWINVNYLKTFSPDIRTTQCYAKVNYNTYLSCNLNKPEKISVDHDQNIKMLNFWSGRRAVYGLYRNKRTMVMTGKLYSETACDTIECIEELGLTGMDINVSGLDSNFDKVIKIASFGRKKISEKPLAFEYILECEFSE